MRWGLLPCRLREVCGAVNRACADRNRQRRRQPQIPCGDDNKKGSGKGRDEIQGSFAALRMTTVVGSGFRRSMGVTSHCGEWLVGSWVEARIKGGCRGRCF